MKRHSIGKRGFPGGSEGRESTCNAGLIPGLRRSPGGGKGYSLQYLPRELHGQRSLAAPSRGCTESDTPERRAPRRGEEGGAEDASGFLRPRFLFFFFFLQETLEQGRALQIYGKGRILAVLIKEERLISCW